MSERIETFDALPARLYAIAAQGKADAEAAIEASPRPPRAELDHVQLARAWRELDADTKSAWRRYAERFR